MSVETEERSDVMVFAMTLVAAGLIAGGVTYWMMADNTKTPGMKEIIHKTEFMDAMTVPPSDRPADRWPNLFGPNRDSVANDANVSLSWPANGPPILWKKPIGVGYSSAVIDRGRLILFQRQGDEEVVAGLDAKTGETQWTYKYPTHYVDRYNYNGGPRCTPIIDQTMVYTLGAEGVLHALEFETGKRIWSRKLNEEYKVEQAFFGVGGSPLLEGDRLIINVGGKLTAAGIVAIDTATGKTLWTATADGPSYATPLAATIHGQRHAFVFTEAGLVDLEPATGKVRWSIPFRSTLFESVNATSPVVVDDIVLVSATYNTGSLCLRIKPDGQYTELWRDRRNLESHFSNMIHVNGYIYAFSGRHEGNTALECVELATGKVRWKHDSDLGRGSSVRVGNRLLLWGERGHLAVLKVDPAKAIMESMTQKNLLDGHCWTPPALCDGCMYLRSETNLSCYDVKKK